MTNKSQYCRFFDRQVIKKINLFLILMFFAGSTILSCEEIQNVKKLSSNKLITTFIFPATNKGFYEPVTVKLDSTRANHSYMSAEVPFEADISGLTSQIEISENATIEPNSGQKIDFTRPVDFVITAQDGTKHTFTVTVTKLPKIDGASLLKSFVFNASDNGFERVAKKESTPLESDDHSYWIATVPSTADIKKLIPTITINSKATITPDLNKQAVDFTKSVDFEVAIPNNKKHTFTITVTKESAIDPVMQEAILLSAIFTDNNNQMYEAVLLPESSGLTNTFYIELPEGMDILSLTAKYEVSPKAAHNNLVFIRSEVAEKTKYYSLTITSADASTSTKYTFKVKETIVVSYSLGSTKIPAKELITTKPEYPNINYVINLYSDEFIGFNKNSLSIIGGNNALSFSDEIIRHNDIDNNPIGYEFTIVKNNSNFAFVMVFKLKYDKAEEGQIKLECTVIYHLGTGTTPPLEGVFDKSTNEHTFSLTNSQFLEFDLNNIMIETNMSYLPIYDLELISKEDNKIEIRASIPFNSRYVGNEQDPFQTTIIFNKEQ